MKTISIDLGTYNSAAAYRMPADGQIILLQAYHGPTIQGRVIPSFLKFQANGELEKYGEPARNDLFVAPELVVWGLKRLIGKSYRDAQDEFHRFHYPIKEKPDEGSIIIPIGEKNYTPIELITLFLQKVKENCEAPFNPIGSTIEKAIITYPAYFKGSQIEAVRRAALDVGFKEVELITEPEAAAAAYRDILDFSKEPLVMVIDWGAGTLDIVICSFFMDKDGKPVVHSVYPAYGDTRLGGIDIDDALMEKVKEVYFLDNLDKESEGRLRYEAETAKIELSTRPWTQKSWLYGTKPYILNFARKREDLPSDQDPTKWVFLEEAIEEILNKFKQHLLYALEKDNLSPEDIDQLILVGGPMNMPCVRGAIREVFKGNEKVLRQLDLIETEGFPVSPLEAVVKGALMRGEREVESSGAILPFTYAFLLDGEYVEETLIEEGTRITNKITKESPEWSKKAGISIKVSLYRKEKTPTGEKHFKQGNYKFFPLASENRPPTLKVGIEIDKNLIPTLKIFDLVAQKTVDLTFVNEKEDPIPPPQPVTPSDPIGMIEEIARQLEKEGLSREEAYQKAKEIVEKIMDDMDRGEISVNEVVEAYKKADFLIKFIETEQREGKTFQTITLQNYQKVKKNLSRINPNKPIKAPSSEFFVFHELTMHTTLLENCLKKEGYKF